jgi:hypothetical protein
MTESLLITGASLRENGYELGEGKYYDTARLLKLNILTGKVEVLLSEAEGGENFPSEHPNLEFTVGTVDNECLWLSMDTEIRKYSYPDLKLLKVFSHPCFHNIHSVAATENSLYVTSTGLDMVVILDKKTGEIQEIINGEGKEIWHRFSPDIDYRKLHSTRPHDCHPNYIFWLEGKPWVTRCTQEDAVCLDDFEKKIEISGSNKTISVHDGVVSGEFVYFTSVDGCIEVADTKTYKVIETIELSDYPGFGIVRGWCRGLYIKDNIFYIGFSKLRKTKNKGKLRWLKNLKNISDIEKECSVLAFDIERREIIKDYPLDGIPIDAIYSILPEPSN